MHTNTHTHTHKHTHARARLAVQLDMTRGHAAPSSLRGWDNVLPVVARTSPMPYAQAANRFSHVQELLPLQLGFVYD